MKRNQRMVKDNTFFKNMQIKLDFYILISYICFMIDLKKKILEHPRNERVVFNEKKHTYLVDGEYYSGVTGWIGKYCKPFNAKKIATNLSKNVPSWQHLSVDEILQLWEDAREYGNYVDKLLEDYVNKGIDNGESEIVQLKNFLKEYELEPICAQWVVFNEDLKKASALDLVCKNKKNQVVIIDVKSMEDPIKISSYKNAKMSFPLLLPDSRYYKFCLQLGIYKKWVEEKYEIDVSPNTYVLRIRPEFYEVIPTLDINNKINELIKFENE